ncbi:MAG TPA: radical SAM/SPASM domain-containing protein, partial [Iamia sp.]|nr:radical SAM/SPASM domain-containing protein [Iamia sp.]
MIPAILSVFLDYQCNYECGHCSVGSSPRTKYPMPEEIFDRVIEGLDEVPTISLVAFTGGEPTLHKQKLFNAIRRVKEKKVTVRVVTNAWWASSDEKARQWVQDLKDAGLDEINTSFDDFHDEFGHVDQIGRLITASVDAGLRVGLGCIHKPGESTFDEVFLRQKLIDLTGLSASAFDAAVSIVEDYPSPFGAAENMDVQGLSAGTRNDFGCREVMKTVSIHPTGAVKACCGHVMLYAKDLEIGNLHDESLATIVDRPSRNLGYWLIHTAGPANLLARMGKPTEHYVSPCHACGDLLGTYRQDFVELMRSEGEQLL